MNQRIISIVVFINLLFILFLSGCGLYNMDIPEYIDIYTNNAAGGRHEFASAVVQGRSADINENYWIIPPGEETKINIFLRNPKNYTLLPIIERYTGTWEASGFVYNASYNVSITSINGNSITIRAEQDPNRKDLVTIFIGEGIQPAAGDEFRLRIRLQDLGSGRDPFEEYYELPLLRCSEYPATPKNASVSRIEKETGEEYGYGLKLSWTQTEQNHAGGPDIMVISADMGLGSETFTRTLDPPDTSTVPYTWTWSEWKKIDDNSITITSGTGYTYHAFQSQKLWPSQTYNVKLAFTNQDGLPSGNSIDYDGTSDWFYVNNDGTPGDPNAGNSPGNPTTLDAAVTKINDSGTIQKVTIVVIGSISNMEPLIIKENKNITLVADDAIDYTVSLKAGSQGSLFTLRENSKLIIGPINNGKSLNLNNNSNPGNNAAFIAVDTGAELALLNGVTVSGNNNTNGSGGGVYINGGTVTMESGSRIYSNSAANGGGVYVNSGGLKMEGGNIHGNTASADLGGGGVIIVDGNLTMNGGSIFSNTVTPSGGKGHGVSVTGGTFTIDKGARVSTDNDVYLASGKRITLGSGITGSDTLAKLSSAVYTGTPLVLTGSSVYTRYVRFELEQPASSTKYSITDTGHIAVSRLEVDISGNKKYYYYLADAFNAVEDNKTAVITMLGNTIATPPCAIEGINKTITLQSGNQNGSITLSSAGNMITVGSGAKLILKTSGSYTLGLTGRTNNTAALIKVTNGGTLEMNSRVSLTGNSNKTAGGYGGGVYVGPGSKLIMESGSAIASNSASNGGGVYVSGTGILIMNGGTIGGEGNANTASLGGGVYLNGGNLDVTGGIISYNSATAGGGIYISNSGAKAKLRNGTIIGSNTSSSDGGGIYISSGGELIMENDSTIASNSAHMGLGRGGGIYVGASGSFVMNGGIIGGSLQENGNTAYSGGGIYLAYVDASRQSSIEIKSGTIRYNLALSMGGGLYMEKPSTGIIQNCDFLNNYAINGGYGGQGGGIYMTGCNGVTIQRCTISENQTGDNGYGAGMVINASSGLSLKDCTFSKNVARGMGGGICISSGGTIIENCTFSENSADSGGGITLFDSPSIITNCTFWKNKATLIPGGGGMYITNGNVPVIQFCTFTANVSLNSPAGGIYNDSNTTKVYGNIIIGNYFGPGTARSEFYSVNNGIFTASANYNLCDSTTSLGLVFKNLSGDGTAQLEISSGTTPTVMIKASGFAHNKIPGTVTWGVPSSDQRGVPRPQDTGTTPYDIGAVERSPGD